MITGHSEPSQVDRSESMTSPRFVSGRSGASAGSRREQPARNVLGRHLLAVAGDPVEHLDDAPAQPTTEHDDIGHADEFGVGEADPDTRPRPIIEQDRETRGLE
jgi:hypothetical protein